jgi:hypothetical protein
VFVPRFLRAFSLRHELVVGFLVTVLSTASWQFLEFYGVFSGAEALVTDVFFWLGSRIDALSTNVASGRARPPSIVTMEIDEVAFKRSFPNGSPLAPPRVISLVDRLAADLRPAVIGIDLLTESDEYRSLEISQPVPFVWTADDKDRLIEDVRFGSWLWGESETFYLSPGPVLGTLRDGPSPDGQVRWGVPLFPRDPDRAVRRFPRRWRFQGTAQDSTRTFARQVAETYCSPALLASGVCRSIGDVEEAFLWHRGRPPSQLKLDDYYSCVPAAPPTPGGCVWTRREPDKLQPLEPGSILLLGGTYADARDSYASSLGENTPGLVLNARAVQVELSGRPVQEVARRLSVLADVVIGYALVVLFWFTHHEHRSNAHKHPFIAWTRGGHLLRRKIQFGGGVAAMLAVLSFPLFVWGGFLWLSWISVLLATFAWDIVRDAWEENPPDELRVRVLEARAKRRSRRSSRR